MRKLPFPPSKCRHPVPAAGSGALTPWQGAGMLALLLATGCTSTTRGGLASPPAPAFSLAAPPVALQIPAGGSGYAMVSATRSQTLTGDITLALAGQPAGISATGTIPAGSSSGRLTVVVDPKATPQSLANLTLSGQAGTVSGSTGFSLTIAAALPASNVPTTQVLASGGQQTSGPRVNQGYALEPVAEVVSTSPSGTMQNRSGFSPNPTPGLP